MAGLAAAWEALLTRQKASPATMRGPTPFPLPVLIGIYSPRPRQGKTAAATGLADILERLEPRALSRPLVSMRPFLEPIRHCAAAFLVHGLGLSDVAATRVLYVEAEMPVVGFGFTGRQLLNWMATTVGRKKIAPDVWLRRNIALIRNDLAAGCTVIVDDVEHPEEYIALRQMGALMVRIVRDQDVDGPKGLLEDKEFDLQLENSGSIPALRLQLSRWVRRGMPSGPHEAQRTSSGLADSPKPHIGCEVRDFDYNGEVVRTVLVDNAPWFVPTDVARALETGKFAVRGYGDGKSFGAGQRIVITATDHPLIFKDRRPPSMAIISHAAVNNWLGRHRRNNPTAAEFLDWIAGVVVPAWGGPLESPVESVEAH